MIVESPNLQWGCAELHHHDRSESNLLTCVPGDAVWPAPDLGQTMGLLTAGTEEDVRSGRLPDTQSAPASNGSHLSRTAADYRRSKTWRTRRTF